MLRTFETTTGSPGLGALPSAIDVVLRIPTREWRTLRQPDRAHARNRRDTLEHIDRRSREPSARPHNADMAVCSRATRTFSARNPGLTERSRWKLLRRSPDPASSTSDNANWTTTNALLSRRAPPDAEPRAPSFRLVCRSTRAARSAGARPNSSAQTAVTPTANSRTIGSTRTWSIRGIWPSGSRLRSLSAHDGEEEPERSTRPGQHRALRQQLRRDPARARAKTASHGHLAIARGRARQQQVRNVRAGDEQQRRQRPTMSTSSGVRVSPAIRCTSGMTMIFA